MSKYDFSAIEKKWQKYWEDHKTFRVTEEVRKNLRKIMDIYIKDHIDREFHSLDILKTLETA